MNENMNKFSTLKPKMFKGKNLKFSQMKRQHWMEADDFLSLHLKHCENIDNEPQTQERRFSFAPWSFLHSIVCGSIKWLGSLIDQKETDPREKSPRRTLIQGRGCTRWGELADNGTSFRPIRATIAVVFGWLDRSFPENQAAKGGKWSTNQSPGVQWAIDRSTPRRPLNGATFFLQKFGHLPKDDLWPQFIPLPGVLLTSSTRVT